MNKFYKDNKLGCTPCNINKCQMKNTMFCVAVDKFNYTCMCNEKYHGQFCQFENACFQKPCQHNSTCLKTLNTFKCECSKGFFGERCENEDPCYFNPCQHNGTCHRNRNNFTCQCRSGYSGAHCQILDTKDKESPGLAVGYIILIVVLIILALGVLIGLVIYFQKRDKQEHIPLVGANTADE